MKLDQVVSLVRDIGFSIPQSEEPKFLDYIQEMITRGHFIIVTDKSGPVAFLTFFITIDYERIYRKATWDTPPDDPHGHQMFIDLLICRKYTLALRRHLQELLESEFPELLEAHYIRAPKDNHIMIKRGSKCIQLKS